MATKFKKQSRALTGSLAVFAGALAMGPLSAAAQEVTSDGGALEDVVVTATKRGIVESAQDVPLSVTAFTGAMLEDQHVRDLQTLNTSVPNVTLSSINTIPGFANFEIRGFGINSSIPSVEPAVGVFVDGVYQGQTSGIVLDLFDLEGVEVLRGPQGTLFGRNTTGGAVLLRTRRPGEDFQVRGVVGYEDGPQYTAALSVEGALTPTLRAKIAAYGTQDDGWFHNSTVDRAVGRREISFVRPTIVWEPNASFETTLIYEHGYGSGDGAVTVNPVYSDDFNVVANYPGYFDLDWQSLTSESNLHVGFGDGIVTSVLGWRTLTQDAGEDLDGGPLTRYHVRHFLEQDQLSAELRYAGTFGQLDLTTGLFYFQQDFNYLEERVLSTNGLNPATLGGAIDQSSWAAFAQGQYHLTDTFSLILGARYSWEEKSARVATLVLAAPRCNFDARTCNYNFPGPAFPEPGTETWSSLSPRIGFQWQPNDDVQVYGSYSQGIRSGGYNVRTTALTVGPGPYDQEDQDSYELGFKLDLADRRLRINGAVFHNEISGLQRDVNQPDPSVGTVQITRNVGAATIDGAELEVTVAPADGLRVGVNVGYIEGQYTELVFDLNGAAPGLGEDLALARLVPWSFGAYIEYERPIAEDIVLGSRIAYGHRDETPFTDANTGFISEVDDLSASVSLAMSEQRVRLSIYGRNLLDEVTNGAAAPLPGSLGGGFFRPINEGRAIGADLRFQF